MGGRDFALDLLFFHRGLNCLVAFELKVGRFEPEYLGKLGFYLEALDRDVRKTHERPAIGVLLCASKDDEVVEYALSRTLSPALIAEYMRRYGPERTSARDRLPRLGDLKPPMLDGRPTLSVADRLGPWAREYPRMLAEHVHGTPPNSVTTLKLGIIPGGSQWRRMAATPRGLLGESAGRPETPALATSHTLVLKVRQRLPQHRTSRSTAAGQPPEEKGPPG